MREVLFRGKNRDGEWFYGGYFRVDNEDYIITNSRVKDFYDLWDIAEEVIPETVGQFTGLTDKNSTKIFEGDMVYCEVWNSNFEIQILEGHFTLVQDGGNNTDFSYFEEDTKYIEVIGNIHDNPELLGE